MDKVHDVEVIVYDVVVMRLSLLDLGTFNAHCMSVREVKERLGRTTDYQHGTDNDIFDVLS